MSHQRCVTDALTSKKKPKVQTETVRIKWGRTKLVRNGNRSLSYPATLMTSLSQFNSYSETPIQLKSDGSVWRLKCSSYRPGVVQRVGRGIALLFHDRGTRREWVVRCTPRPHLTPGKDPAPILREAGWAPGPVWTSGKSRPHRESIPDRPARSWSLYRLSYPTHALFECTS